MVRKAYEPSCSITHQFETNSDRQRKQSGHEKGLRIESRGLKMHRPQQASSVISVYAVKTRVISSLNLSCAQSVASSTFSACTCEMDAKKHVFKR